MIDLAIHIFGGAFALLACVAIVSDVRRHWPDIVRIAHGRDADPINWVEVRLIDGKPVDFIPESTNDGVDQ